ncbi:hypothetical protein NOVO_06775 [Rickettsiales bacterium Ac37b]|nr:hypothetical protein NOVO_06775 [Rickettsiales bacterium Ac37b]
MLRTKGKGRADTITFDQPEAKIRSSNNRRTLIGEIPSIIKEGIKKPGNILNLSIIGFAAVCNAILAHTSLTVSFILAGISCLQPAVTDFGYNYKLIKNELLKNKDIKTLQDKALEITKFIWPGIVAVVVGALFFGLHIRLYNQGAEVVSSVLLAVGTFIAGSAQMLVKPMIKREVARKNPPAPMVGEIEILIQNEAQLAKELETELSTNNVIISQKLEELAGLIKVQNDPINIKVMNIQRILTEKHKTIEELTAQVNNITEERNLAREAAEKFTQANEQLTQQLEQEREKAKALRDKLDSSQQPVPQINTAVAACQESISILMMKYQYLYAKELLINNR